MQSLIVVFLVILGAFGTLFLKIGAVNVVYSSGLRALLRSSIFNLPLVIGMLMQIIPLVSWVVLLKYMPMTKLQPMIALTYVITPLLAVMFLGEEVSVFRALGIGLIVVGVALVSIS